MTAAVPPSVAPCATAVAASSCLASAKSVFTLAYGSLPETAESTSSTLTGADDGACDADKALVSHHGDFRRSAVLQHIQQGHDAVGRKIDMAQDIAGLVQNHAERHWDELQVRIDASALYGVQRRKKLVLLRMRRRVRRCRRLWPIRRTTARSVRERRLLMACTAHSAGALQHRARPGERSAVLPRKPP